MWILIYDDAPLISRSGRAVKYPRLNLINKTYLQVPLNKELIRFIVGRYSLRNQDLRPGRFNLIDNVFYFDV